MKYLIFILSFLCTSFLHGQDCDIPTNAIHNFEISEVVEVGDYSKAEIYNAVLLSSADYVKNPTEITKYEDYSAGVLIWELETRVRTVIGGGNFFFFNVKMEMKDGKYRMSVTYTDCIFIISEDSSCSCANDIAAYNCLPNDCLFITDKRWNLLKCTAVDQLYGLLDEYKSSIKANISKSQW